MLEASISNTGVSFLCMSKRLASRTGLVVTQFFLSGGKDGLSCERRGKRRVFLKFKKTI